MKLIVGLGNIGDKYVFTRHNAGFMVLDKWVLDAGLSFKQESKLKCYAAKLKLNNLSITQDVLLAKPTTLMNLSGEAVRAIADYYKIDVEDILVVYDDLALDLGVIRFRADGSDGGHNGIKSIIKHLGTNKFARLKIGIGPQPPIPSENFVLQNFPKEQHDELKSVLKKSVAAIEYYLQNGLEKSQNMYN
jgi:PTH1 family peptidyl-tRNA hydrolase